MGERAKEEEEGEEKCHCRRWNYVQSLSDFCPSIHLLHRQRGRPLDDVPAQVSPSKEQACSLNPVDLEIFFYLFLVDLSRLGIGD